MNLIESLMEEFDFVPIDSKQMYFTIAKMCQNHPHNISDTKRRMQKEISRNLYECKYLRIAVDEGSFPIYRKFIATSLTQ